MHDMRWQPPAPLSLPCIRLSMPMKIVNRWEKKNKRSPTAEGDIQTIFLCRISSFRLTIRFTRDLGIYFWKANEVERVDLVMLVVDHLASLDETESRISIRDVLNKVRITCRRYGSEISCQLVDSKMDSPRGAINMPPLAMTKLVLWILTLTVPSITQNTYWSSCKHKLRIPKIDDLSLFDLQKCYYW